MEKEEILNKQVQRGRIIIRTSVIGILANIALAAFKAVVGLLSNSIAIVLDAVNNISDAASSVITIVGTKLAAREPDKKHPYGYGRIEYLSAMVISLIVLYAGITSFVESVKKIIKPETPDYSAVVLVIVAAGVLVKIVLGRYVKSTGLRVNSDSLVNSGEDAVLDSVISASTLAAAVIYLVFHISLEAWLGALISIVIIKSGIEMLRDTISQLLGERADISLAHAIKNTIKTEPDVSGVYDLVLHNYGPDYFQASVHIEVPDTVSVSELDEKTRMITEKVYKEHQVILTAVGVYARNTKEKGSEEIYAKVRGLALGTQYVQQIHGFYVKLKEKQMRFDLVISFDAPSRREVYQTVVSQIQGLYPDYTIFAALDTDFTEE